MAHAKQRSIFALSSPSVLRSVISGFQKTRRNYATAPRQNRLVPVILPVSVVSFCHYFLFSPDDAGENRFDSGDRIGCSPRISSDLGGTRCDQRSFSSSFWL